MANQQVHLEDNSGKCSHVICRDQPTQPDGTKGRLVTAKFHHHHQTASSIDFVFKKNTYQEEHGTEILLFLRKKVHLHLNNITYKPGKYKTNYTGQK